MPRQDAERLSLRQRALRRAEQIAVLAAKTAYPLHRALGEARPGPRVQPRWAPAPLIRKASAASPSSWPRETDSLCPECVKQTREAILSGRTPLSELVDGNPGEVKAQILEDSGRIVMRKTCPVHGEFEDVMSVSLSSSRESSACFRGGTTRRPREQAAKPRTSSIKYGRGSVLTGGPDQPLQHDVRPCFMDANQAGYVHGSPGRT
ncbi:MAG: hypothetical protein R3B89_12280 [Polyangiaceae bacterium]